MQANKIFENFTRGYQPKKSSLAEGQIVVLYGPPCTDKTTLNRLMDGKYDLHRLSMDDLRKQYDPKDLFTITLFLKEIQTGSKCKKKELIVK
jgi:replication-associated recombination protein RarA